MQETRAQREKRRYHWVLRATYDPKIARKARGWSDERIYRELGIRVGKKTPKQKVSMPDLPRDKVKKRRRRADRRQRKYQYAREKGIGVDQAMKMRDWSWNRIYNYLKKGTGYQKDRLSQWKIWSSKKGADFPQNIKDMAYEANRRWNVPAYQRENARYGWFVAFYSYIYNIPFEQVMKRWRPRPQDPDQYVKVLKEAGVLK